MDFGERLEAHVCLVCRHWENTISDWSDFQEDEGMFQTPGELNRFWEFRRRVKGFSI